ncbi:MFS transporter [Streptomyces sp. NPDC002659]|uniref:MFS transporter n=1 Tax=Streptomyces sp. NPDC002659 TaxID=3364656 RepID=UPI003692F763
MTTNRGELLGLTPKVWLILAGALVSSVGSGATIPYLFTYLNKGQGLDAGVIGGLLTVRAVGAVAGAALGGAWTDSLGARRAVLWGQWAAAATTLAILGVGSPITGVVVLAVFGVVGSALSVALGALLGQVTSREEREKAFGISYALGNGGSAGGALVGALVMGAWPSTGYFLLYTVDAASFGAYALVIWKWVAVAPAPQEAASTPETSVTIADYRTVARDRAMRWLCLITALVTLGGYCQLHVGIPALVATTDSPATAMGFMFAANMIAVVVLQPLTQRLFKFWSHATKIATGALVMGSAWGLIQVAPGMSVTVLAAAGVIFAVGEVLLAPVLPSLVNDLAPARLLGRYNGAHTLAKTGGWLVGTALTGAILAAHYPQALLPAFTLLLAAAAMAGLRLRKVLPADTYRPPGPETAQVSLTKPRGNAG